MTPQELAHLDAALAITLPEAYKALFDSFPIPAYSGNSDIAVWDHAERLLKLNLEYRTGAPGGLAPWPPHLYAMGHAGDGCPYAVDLRDESVWWVDHGSVDNPTTQQEAALLGPWLAHYFEELRAEMVGEEVDPDGLPADRERSEAKAARANALGCLIAIVVLVLVMWGIRMALRWLR